MKINYRVLRSVKLASVCKYLGCDVTLQPDGHCPGKVVFQVSPASGADQAIERFESGEAFPGRPLMDALSHMHSNVKAFLYQYKLLSGGKPMSTADHD